MALTERDLSAVIMNPVRQRIAEYILLHGPGTVGDMAAEMTDVPRPSLYRHIRVMAEAGLLEVTAEERKRGAVEKTYALAQMDASEFTDKDLCRLLQGTLFSLAGSFGRYFAKGGADPKKDMLSVSSATLLLSDEEYMEMLGRIGAVYNDYITNKPEKGRKTRCITIVSSPAEDMKEENE